MPVVVHITSKDSTKGGINSARSNVRRLNASVKKATRSMQLLAVAAAGVAIKAVNDFAKFDNRVREISTLLDNVTEKDIKNLGNEIKKTALAYGQSLDKMAKARYDIISAGFNDAARSAIVLEQSAKLAVGGISDVSETASVLTKVLNSYGLAVDKAGYVSDILFKTVKLGQTTIRDLTSSFGVVASIAPQLGISLRELAANLAVVTKTSPNTEIAVTSLQVAMIEFLKPSEDLQKRLQDIGYDSGIAAIKTLGFTGALRAVTKDVPTEELGKMFTNIRAIRAVMPLIGSSADDVSKALDEMGNVTGATDEAFGKMAKGIKFRLDQIKVQAEIAMTNIGERVILLVGDFLDLEPAIQNTAVAVGGLALAFKFLGGPITAVIAIAATIYRAWKIGFFDLMSLEIDRMVLEWKIGWNSMATELESSFLLKIGDVVSALAGIFKIGFAGSWKELTEAGGQLQEAINDISLSDEERIKKSIEGTKKYIEALQKTKEAIENLQLKPFFGSESLFSGIGGPSIDQITTNEQEKLDAKQAFLELEHEMRAIEHQSRLDMMELEKDVAIGYTQEMLEAEKNYITQRSLLWRSAEAGYNTFVGNLLATDMTGKEKSIAIWRSVKQAFIGFLADMLKEKIATFFAEQALAKAGYTEAIVSGTATAAALSSAYATPATLASIMSFGGAAATGTTALALAVETGNALAASKFQQGSPFVSNGAFSGTDTVPAFLSEGEAVIDAPTVRRNATVVQQLVGGQEIIQNSSQGNNTKIEAHFNIQAIDVRDFADHFDVNIVKEKLVDLINDRQIRLNVGGVSVQGEF